MQLLCPISILLPTFYMATHMRYLIPIIPLLLLMLFEPRPFPTYNPNTLE